MKNKRKENQQKRNAMQEVTKQNMITNYALSNKRPSAGITLIALVVTIVVLLILAGVTLNLVIGNNGIIKKASEADLKTINARVYEELKLVSGDYYIEETTGQTSDTFIQYLQNKEIVGDEVDSKIWQINVEKLLGTQQKYGKGDYLTNGKQDVYLLEDAETKYNVQYYNKSQELLPLGELPLSTQVGPLYETVCDTHGDFLVKNENGVCYYIENEQTRQWKEFKESDANRVIENVKEFTSYYYLTNDNVLYHIDTNTEVARNVKEFNNNYYLTNDSVLYNIYDHTETASNVKESDDNYYLTNDDVLYKINGTKISENVKEWIYHKYLTNDNVLYNLDNTEVARNVKEFNSNYYLTNDNVLYNLDNAEVARNVKACYSYYGEDYYLTNDNVLYDMDTNIGVARNVKKFDNNYYITNDNVLYQIDGTKISENVKTFGDHWFITTDNRVFLHHYQMK